MPHASDHLKTIQNFKDLIHYLEEKLDWPLQEYGFDELTFEYQPAELGLKDEEAAKVKNIHQLRPLQGGQPWGIFFVEFENKKLPVVVLRRILSHLVIKKRASANKAKEAAWHAEDLMFITTFGEDNTAQREIAFAHFHQFPGDLPTLRVLGWDGGDTPLKLAHVDYELRQNLSWPDDPADRSLWREQWRKPFRHRIGHVIRTADALADALAALARGIRDKAIKMIAVESSDGPLRQLHKAFQTALIHDLTEESFADTYAQTITYGLLTAAISRTEGSEGRHGTFIIAENVTDMVPNTNPFLQEMLQTFLKVGGRKGGIDFDELGIQDVVELLRGEETDLPAILRDFGNKTQGEDPVIHFYEHFLSAYNKKLKIQRGVFYTPQPVVSYIIRSVHELLQNEFGLEDGLASTVTWGEMIARYPEMKPPVLTPRNPAKPESKDILISSDTPFVMILDIATGTGTFLVEVIDVISKTMKGKWQKEGKSESEIGRLWNEYVPKHLLPRVYGYELMMAPYAIAHMKIGLKLFETGYQFKSNERVRVYLTNTLEPPSDAQQQLAGILPALAHEAEAVNEVKRNNRFTVVVGNPPYSLWSQNLADNLRTIIDPYRFVNGEAIKERGALQFEKILQDDYIKFFRFSQVEIERSLYGILGLITNHAFIDNPTLRGLRNSLLGTFQRIFCLNLHGNSSKKEKNPDGAADKNVFDIKQGVAIFHGLRHVNARFASRFCGDLWGTRESKYEALSSLNLQTVLYRDFTPEAPFFLFKLRDSEFSEEYDRGWRLSDMFIQGSMGIVTARDHVTIAFDDEALLSLATEFRDSTQSDNVLCEKLEIPEKKGWDVAKARKYIKQEKNLRTFIKQIDYRPFDTRKIFYHRSLVWGMSWPTMQHVLDKQNIGISTTRSVETGEFRHVLASQRLIGHHFVSLKEVNYFFPLWLYPDSELLAFNRKRSTNMKPEFIRAVNQYLYMRQESGDKATQELTQEDIFYYIYAIFYSPTYRARYSSFLKVDFPRVPLTASLKIFCALATLGNKLVAIHLLESPEVLNFITRFTGKGGYVVHQKPTWKENAVWINETQRFEGVPEKVWNFHIGGYQVCEKWLKDRKGRTLTNEDIKHYQCIIVALNETIRIMAEIDRVINEHGGWPGAFQTDETTTVKGDASLNNVVQLQKSAAKIQRNYTEPEQPSLSLVADSGASSSPDHQLPGEAATKAEPRRNSEIPDREDLICLVRQVFGDGIERERDAAITDLAHELGYQRTSSKIADELDDVLRTAVRRGIVENTGGMLKIAANSIELYERNFLKDQFVSSLGGRQWIEREEAIRGFARWLGYLRTGKNIDETARSLINGLIREGRIESDGTQIRRSS